MQTAAASCAAGGAATMRGCTCSGAGPAPRAHALLPPGTLAQTPLQHLAGRHSTARQRGHQQLRGTVCMAEPRRVARVSKQLEREIGTLFLYDKVLQKAICPERRKGLDSAASAIASVTEVRITGDLQVAKVYVSIFSDAEGKAAAMQQLIRLQGYVRKQIGSSMSLRLTPEIRFIYDESHERSERVLKLLKQIKLQDAGVMEPPPIAVPMPPPEDDEWDKEEGEEAEDGADVEAAADGEDADEDAGGFFDEEDEEEAEEVVPAFGGGSRRASNLRMAAVLQPDSSFFGFEDPGAGFNEDDDVAWKSDEELARLGGDLAAVGVSDADGWLEEEPVAEDARQKGRRAGRR